MQKFLKIAISVTILACLLISFFHVHFHFNEIYYKPIIYNDRDCQEHHHISSKECGECITKNEKYKKNYLFKSISDKHYSTLINHKITNDVEFYIFYNSYCRPPPSIKTA